MANWLLNPKSSSRSRPSDLDAAAHDLLLTAQRLVEGVSAGRHLARGAGDADEFYDFKPYAPGDALARVDWRVAARRDDVYLRRRRHEASLHVALIFDTSASMGFRSLTPQPWPTKLQVAREFAAALALIARRQRDRVSLIVGGEAIAAPATDRAAVIDLLTTLHRLTPAGSGGAAPGLRAAASAAPEADLFILLTDALDPPEDFAAAVAHATARARSPREILCVQILSEDELRPAPAGVTLIDPESRSRAVVATPQAADHAAHVVARHVEFIRSTILRARGRYELHRTSDSVASTLRRLLTWRR